MLPLSGLPPLPRHESNIEEPRIVNYNLVRVSAA
jgi:hypothetical protein